MKIARTPHRIGHLALACAAAIALSACSRNGADTSTPQAAASAPVNVAMAPVPNVAPNPSYAPAPAPARTVVAPTRTVVARNDAAYEAGRRDQRRDDRSAARELPPRADRDVDAPPPSSHEAWRDRQQVAAASCPDCGVVESIVPIRVQGQTNGTGAVAGGVGGAVIGNRIAGGGNRTIGGIVGAVGGGLLGNAIEKHERTTTVYDVNVRMSDGSLRTVRQSSSPAVGDKVLVESDGLHLRT